MFLPSISFQGGLRAQVESVRVDKQCRNMGIGSQMMEWTIQCARERGAHVNRIKGLLFAQGIRGINVKARYKTLQVDKLLTGDGRTLPPRLAQEVLREIERLRLVQTQLAEAERERDEAPTPCTATEKKRTLLIHLKGLGPTISAVMAREVFYRQFANRRQVASFLGVTPSPYDSGEANRCQGISRSGSGPVRAIMLQGADLRDLGWPVATLSIWLAVCFPTAMKLFRWR
jgi:transposase